MKITNPPYLSTHLIGAIYILEFVILKRLISHKTIATEIDDLQEGLCVVSVFDPDSISHPNVYTGYIRFNFRVISNGEIPHCRVAGRILGAVLHVLVAYLHLKLDWIFRNKPFFPHHDDGYYLSLILAICGRRSRHGAWNVDIRQHTSNIESVIIIQQ